MSNDVLPTIRQLQYFRALADAGNFRKAAESIGISQPSLSQQIANLEKVLRVSLIERGRSGAILTAAGREVLSRSIDILEDVKAVVGIAEQVGSGALGTYRLGASATFGPYLLPSVVRQLHSDHPTLRLFIRDGRPRDLLDDLFSGRLDLVLSQLPVLSSELNVVRLFREPLFLAVSRDHRLASRKNVEDIDLKGETLLVLSNGFSLHDQLVDLAQTLGATLQRDYEGSSLDALRQMVAMNMGVTLLPALYAGSEVGPNDGDVALIPFRQGRVSRSIGLIWRRTSRNPPAFDAFSDQIRTVVKTKFSDILQLEG